MCIYDSLRYLCTAQTLHLIHPCEFPHRCAAHIRYTLPLHTFCDLCAEAAHAHVHTRDVWNWEGPRAWVGEGYGYGGSFEAGLRPTTPEMRVGAPGMGTPGLTDGTSAPATGASSSGEEGGGGCDGDQGLVVRALKLEELFDPKGGVVRAASAGCWVQGDVGRGATSKGLVEGCAEEMVSESGGEEVAPVLIARRASVG